MNIRTAIILLFALILLGLASTAGWAGSSDIPSYRASGPGLGHGSMLQDNGGDEGGGDEAGGGDEQPSEEQPAAPAAGGMSDVIGQPAPAPASDENLNNALAGIADYEVTYDTSLSREELTPPALRELGVTYAGEESPVAQRTQALRDFDLIDILAERYETVETEYAADPEEDFAPEDPENTFNYFQPRTDPFLIPELIPEELRPEVAGTGLSGAVDPELLEKLYAAQYEANLRLIPLIVIGVMEAGPNRICMYTIAGYGATLTIQEGESQCIWYWPPFSVTASQISEDSVTLTLIGYYDMRCNYAATNPVPRTFHVNR